MTNAITGDNGIVKIGSTAIAEWTRATLKSGRDKVEVTSKDSGKWKEFLMGHKEWSATLDCNFYPGDTTGQKTLMNSYFNDTLVSGFTVLNTSGGTQFSGTIFVSDFPIDLPVKDAEKVTFTLQGTGALVMS